MRIYRCQEHGTVLEDDGPRQSPAQKLHRTLHNRAAARQIVRPCVLLSLPEPRELNVGDQWIGADGQSRYSTCTLREVR